MGQRITLKDVAALAGVSRSAASLALRGDGRLAPETRERVRRAMDELGYVYNRTAAALREKERRLVGVVVTSVENTFFAQSVQAIETALDQQGYLSVLANSLRDRERQRHIIRSMREFGVAGIILAAVEDSIAEAAAELEAAGIPCLSFTRTVGDRPIAYVGPNDYEGGRCATVHLLGHGARTFAYVGGLETSSAARERRAGIEDELAKSGAAAPLRVFPGDMTLDGGVAAGRELLASGPLPDAVVCASDNVAFGMYRAFRDAGVVDLPRVIGFDDLDMAEIWHPRLTTVSSHPTTLGMLAAEIMLERLRSTDAPLRSEYLAPDLVIRESCGCG